MQHRKWRSVWALLVLTFVPLGFAEAAIDPNARTVLVRSNCTGIDDCFTSLLQRHGVPVDEPMVQHGHRCL